MSDNPLGRPSVYSSTYSPGLLHAIPRSEARGASGIGIDAQLLFGGTDLWNAWELSWLDERGKPVAATAELQVDAGSRNIVESKSLKLYLNSLAMTRYPDADTVAELIFADLANVIEGDIELDLYASGTWGSMRAGTLPGRCIDDLDIDIDGYNGCVAADSLHADDAQVTRVALHSHLLRSNCPVTGQPDSGSLLIRYSGRHIDEASLLRYIASYRNHHAYHEACVEQIFVDIMRRCAPAELTVYARYNRRGGLDINPFRSNFESLHGNARLWRQ
jgi:7-cyano-7-deazaguanine reductase